MKLTQKKEITYEIIPNSTALSQEDMVLFEAAQKARQNAYAPYSHFWVGAALLLSNGEIIIGNNQENAAYPSGLCAERTAAYAAKSQYPNEKIIKMAIIAGKESGDSHPHPVAPCGNCRQSLLEYEVADNQPMTILFSGISGDIIKVQSVADLLPFCFTSNDL